MKSPAAAPPHVDVGRRLTTHMEYTTDAQRINLRGLISVQATENRLWTDGIAGRNRSDQVGPEPHRQGSGLNIDPALS